MPYKTVAYPIHVPRGKYCWDTEKPEMCEHFDNEGGHPTCNMDFSPIHTPMNVLKPGDCLKLKIID